MDEQWTAVVCSWTVLLGMLPFTPWKRFSKHRDQDITWAWKWCAHVNRIQYAKVAQLLKTFNLCIHDRRQTPTSKMLLYTRANSLVTSMWCTIQKSLSVLQKQTSGHSNTGTNNFVQSIFIITLNIDHKKIPIDSAISLIVCIYTYMPSPVVIHLHSLHKLALSLSSWVKI